MQDQADDYTRHIVNQQQYFTTEYPLTELYLSAWRLHYEVGTAIPVYVVGRNPYRIVFDDGSVAIVELLNTPAWGTTITARKEN